MRFGIMKNAVNRIIIKIITWINRGANIRQYSPGGNSAVAIVQAVKTITQYALFRIRLDMIPW